MKVGFQGIKGAFSEAAIYKEFGENAGAIGYSTFEDVFEAVVNEELDYGIIPVENSIAGSVSQNYDFFLEKEVHAIKEVYQPIQHYLLGIPGSQLTDIKVALSHPMALKQCELFLKEYNIKQLPEYDTAGAAKIVAEKKLRDHAAVASSLASEYYQLDILAENIQSNNVNVTRFLVIRKDIPKNIIREKTSIAFKTKHHPGALEECLHALSSNGINLTKIQSRPIPENPWEYVFYADFEGGTDAPRVKKALRELEDVSKYLKIIGSYPKGSRRAAR